MNAEFNWWLLIVGLVIGAALTWLVMAESTRREADLLDEEQRSEALWIASMLSPSGDSTDPARVEQVLRLHREYLAAPPPDEPVEEPDPAVAEEPDPAVAEEPDPAVAEEPDPAVAEEPDPAVAEEPAGAREAVPTRERPGPDLAASPGEDAAPEVVSMTSEDRP